MHLLYFTTPMCAPCKTYGPALRALAKRLDVPLMEYNAEDPANARLVGSLDITTVPTTIIVRDNEPLEAYIGLGKLNAIEKYIVESRR